MPPQRPRGSLRWPPVESVSRLDFPEVSPRGSAPLRCVLSSRGFPWGLRWILRHPSEAAPPSFADPADWSLPWLRSGFPALSSGSAPPATSAGAPLTARPAAAFVNVS